MCVHVTIKIKFISCVFLLIMREKNFTSSKQDANAWALLGHTHYLTGNYSSAKDAYERTVNYVHLPAHVHLVYLRLADIYLKQQEVKNILDLRVHTRLY